MERDCFIGVCDGVNAENSKIWAYCSNGRFYDYNKNNICFTCEGFMIDDVITLRLNMFNHTLGYSKNGSEIDFQWTQLSDKLFPVVSSKYAYNTRICSHDKP